MGFDAGAQWQVGSAVFARDAKCGIVGCEQGADIFGGQFAESVGLVGTGGELCGEVAGEIEGIGGAESHCSLS